MKKYKYVIVGGGMTGDASITGIRELDLNGSVLLISAEPNPPYNRPPLSKGLWKGKPLDSIWRKTDEKQADFLLDQVVTSINPKEKTITVNAGDFYGYEKLLLATGGKNRHLPFGGEYVVYYRTVDDFKKLKNLTETKQKFAVIGTGFIGSEISAALAMNGKDVTVLDIGPGIGWNIFSPDLNAHLNQYYQEKNVNVIPNVKVSDMSKIRDFIRISTDSGDEVEVEAVVAGVGIVPDVDLAEGINLKVENGITVNEFLQTSDPEIYAAGDAANFYNPLLGKPIRVEHADNANAMGKQAGRNMAGAGELYDYLPFFYSDLFDLGYEAVGLLDSRFKIVEDWSEKYGKGVLYYLNEDRVSGVLLWNVWDKVEEARKIIGLPAPVKESDLIGRIS
ncbi:MAG: FAD/NAD(P)-binding oxidoreductase [Pelolinea sp.]|nr:FAD/NAD(P)-binding oxidoreductase [Pelolinea sp.]